MKKIVQSIDHLLPHAVFTCRPQVKARARAQSVDILHAMVGVRMGVRVGQAHKLCYLCQVSDPLYRFYSVLNATLPFWEEL